jgi:hypothetical protein
VVFAFVVAGGFAMAWNGLSFTAAAELAGMRRSGAALGMRQSALSAAGAIVPPAFAAVVAVSSWRLGFGLAALFPLLGCSFFARCDRRVVTVRVLDRLDELYAIGGGSRLAYTAEEDAAHELAAGWMREAGLEVSSDGVGNLFGRRGGARVWSGSHLDTVPDGGKFDGALGVVAAIEAAERLAAAPLAVVAFRAEESGPMGSRRLTEHPEAFLELHIEQGPTLERLGEPLAVVTGIAGQARGSVSVEGRAATRYDADG